MRYALSIALVAAAAFVTGCKHDEVASSDAGRTSQQSWDQSAQRAADSMAPASSDLTAQANQMLDQSLQYIKENKYDLADQTITKLEQWKPQLPTSYAPRIDQARSMLNAAKSAGQNMSNITPAP